MSTAPVLKPVDNGATVAAPRVVSIDIFRGLTMAVMIFVNALSEDAGLPWWTYHAHAQQDLMTYVDMVFPFFLFILGVSLPISVTQRLKRNPSQVALWGHVLVRFVSLLVLGLFLANAEMADAKKMGISGSVWALLGLICAALFLNVYGEWKRFPAYSLVLRAVGLIGVVLLLSIFRRTTDGGKTAWLDFGYPEILGLIAYTYLAVSFLYIPTRRWKWATPTWFVLLAALNVVTAAKLIVWPDRLAWYFWPFSNGSMACIVMAGVVASGIFLGSERRPSPSRAISWALAFAVIMLAAGRVFTPLGISKIRATPTWSFYSIGAALLLFAFLYWICDVKKWTGWALFVRPAGANTLTTYLLPDIWYFSLASLGFVYLDTHFNLGWQDVVKTILFTFLILGISGVLTRARVRLQL